MKSTRNKSNYHFLMAMLLGIFSFLMLPSVMAQESCQVQASATPELKGKELKLQLTNLSGEPITIDQISATWPETAGQLRQIKLGGKIYAQPLMPPMAIINDGWKDEDPKKRQIKAGKTKTLVLKFDHEVKNLDLADFALTVDFLESCQVMMAPADENCLVQGLTDLKIDDNKIEWQLFNFGAEPAVLEELQLNWPATNGDLLKIKLDGTVFDGAAAPDSLLLTQFDGDTNDHTIKPGKKKKLKLEFANLAGASVAEDYAINLLFAPDCEANFNAAPDGDIAVLIRTYFESLEVPASDGVIIQINGQTIGSTDSNGTFSASLPVGVPAVIRAILPNVVGGEMTITPQVGDTNLEIDIIMDGEALAADADLIMTSLIGGVLPSDFDALTIQLDNQFGQTIALTSVDRVELFELSDPDNFTDVTALFALDNGALMLTDVPGFSGALTDLLSFGQYGLLASGADADLFIYEARTSFYRGNVTVSGALAAPPSNPALSLDGVIVTAEYLVDSSIIFSQPVGADGVFTWPQVPAGNWSIEATTAEGEVIYTGLATFSVLNAINVQVNMLALEDLLNGVPLFVIISGGEALTVDNAALHAQRLSEQSLNTVKMAAQVGMTQISVTAGPESIPVFGFDNLVVPMGTQTIFLNYEIVTQEYPFYVLQQSEFNDIWAIFVLNSNGAVLFNQALQVNSQLTVPPIWQSNGSTGTITEELDVSALTANGDASLILFGYAMNIGDSILPTSVTAALDFEAALRIEQITPDTLANTTGNNDYYSIPETGTPTNTLERDFRVKINRPPDTTVTNVKASLVQEDGTELMTIVDEAPGGMFVTEVNDENLDVVITMSGANPSTINSAPPPVHNIRYRFEVTVEDDMGMEQMDEKDSERRKALWRMPASLARFGTRDAGGDDWSAKGAYEWLETNTALVPQINDVSGEHGRNIGHATHAEGTDIDTYHYHHLATIVNGTLNYVALTQRTQAALGGDAAARTDVIAFIQGQRDGLDTLSALATVSRLFSAQGAASGNLPNGWVHTLMTAGTLTAGANTLNLGIGTWTASAKMNQNHQHNNHNHIDLNDSMLNNAP